MGQKWVTVETSNKKLLLQDIKQPPSVIVFRRFCNIKEDNEGRTYNEQYDSVGFNVSSTEPETSADKAYVASSPTEVPSQKSHSYEPNWSAKKKIN